MQITLKRAVAILSAIAAFVSISRVCVLFLESLSAVRDERSQDTELLEICSSGIARGSMKMRSACLQAQADRASPIVLKAILRAVSTAFQDFSDSVSSPGKLLVVAMFVLSSLFLPITTWLKAVFPQEVVEGQSHVVVLAHDGDAGMSRIGLKRRIAGALMLKQGSSHSRIGRMAPAMDLESELEGRLVDIDPSNVHAKWE